MVLSGLNTMLAEWSDFCRTELQSPQPMTEEQSKAYLGLIVNEQKVNTEFMDPGHEVHNDSFYRMATLRSTAIGLDISPAVILFIIAYLCTSPGDVVMYLSYLRANQFKTNNRIDVSEFTFLFPMGFFSDESRRRIWEAQKLNGKIRDELREFEIISDNMLDILSLFKEKEKL